MEILFARERGGSAAGLDTTGLAESRVIGAVRVSADGVIAAANDAFLRMTGRSRDEVAAGALRWNELFGEMRSSEPWHVDVAHADGRVVTLLVEVLAWDEEGWTACVIDVSATRIAEHALVRAREVLEERTGQLFGAQDNAAATAADLETERRRVEELAARLANANRELDAFSYSVSHDLRTPLRSIDGFSRVLLSHYAPQLDERGRDYLQRVRNATQRMSQLLDDLLGLARASRATFAHANIDLSAGAEQIAAELQQTDPNRRVAWRIQPGLTVRGDRTLLRVLLENLLGNAWKFTSRREEAVIELGCEDGVFFVRDNGAGFDMAYADQLFGVFQRLHTAEEFEGTGIGLATVQRIVHRHGGSIRAEAAVGTGATFYFTLHGTNP